MITKQTCEKLRLVVNKRLSIAAKECNLNFEQINQITFDNDKLSFKIEMFSSEIPITEAKIDKLKLKAYGFVLNQTITCINGLTYILVGTYKNGFEIKDSNDKILRCKHNFINFNKSSKRK
jgi:hypothetical protein